MAKINKSLRVVAILLLFVVGTFVLLGPVGPSAESAVHQRAVRASVYGQGDEAPDSDGFSGGVVEATSVNLADVEFVPVESMYERWLRGEVDIDEMEFRVSPAERLELQKAAENIGFPEDGIIIDDALVNAPEQGAVTVQATFASLDVSDCCGGGTSVPPDSDMAAGVNHIIAVENSSFEIYDKTGTVVVAATLFDNLFSDIAECSGTFDPTVMFDSETDHFVMAVETGAYFCLAVTQTDDPTAGWYLYAFDARYYGDEFFDYPHIGIGDHAIFMGANMFGGSVPNGFEGRIYVMDKNAAYAGFAMLWRSYSTGYDGSTPQPLNLTGFKQGTVPQPFNTHYFISDYYDGSTAWLWAWPDALGTGTPSVVQTYSLMAGGFPVASAQKGSSDKISANDWRFRGFEYRNGYGWTTDTISMTPDSTVVDVLRFISIDLSGAPYTLTTQQALAFNSTNMLFPDLAVDHCGNVIVGFEASDANIYPKVMYSGWNSAGAGSVVFDTTGTIKLGETSYTSFDTPPFRWGDYSGMAIDPDGKTFWYMGEYAKNISGYSANYGNYIAKMTYNCDTSNVSVADVDVEIGGVHSGDYFIPSGNRVYPRYGINGGPVKVTSANNTNIFTSQRVIYKDSFTETLPFPANQMTTEYWYTSLDDYGMTTYLVIGNPDPSQTALVDVYIGGTKMNSTPYSIAPNERIYPRYGINGGPVKVVSTNGVNIFTSQRVIYKDSFTETLPFPANQMTTEYWYTSLDDYGMTTYLVIGNPDPSQTALVDVYIGGTKMNSTPYSIAPSERIYPRYGINDGPVKVVSTNGVNIFTSQRVIYKDSFTETLPFPANQMTTEYWYTSLDDYGMTTYLVIGNPDPSQTALVDVYIGDTKMNSTPYSIAPSERIYPRYGINGGPVKVVSTNGVNIFTSQRVIYKDSFTETLPFPSNQMTTEYWYTSLDDYGMTTYLVIGNP